MLNWIRIECASRISTGNTTIVKCVCTFCVLLCHVDFVHRNTFFTFYLFHLNLLTLTYNEKQSIFSFFSLLYICHTGSLSLPLSESMIQIEKKTNKRISHIHSTYSAHMYNSEYIHAQIMIPAIGIGV